jgi:hypothetical protein
MKLDGVDTALGAGLGFALGELGYKSEVPIRPSRAA